MSRRPAPFRAFSLAWALPFAFPASSAAVLASGAALATGTVLLAGCDDAAANEAAADSPTAERASSDQPAGLPPVAVTLAPVLQSPLAAPVRAVGRVRAVDELPLSFPFGGVVKSLQVEAGEHVHKGQILAVLDAAAATAQLEQAESALTKAERDADRAARLSEANAVADATLKDARTGVSVARAQRDAAAFQARRSVLVAPADGVVLDRFVEPEQTVAPGTPILSIASQGGFELLVDVAAADAQALLPGAEASVVVDAVSSEPVGGHVLRKAGGAGPLGTWRVTVALDPHEGLASGLLGVATLTPPASPRPSIPVGALAEADGSSGAVYTVDGEGKARRVPVKVAFLTGDRVALADDGGATLVIDQGVAFVRDGAAVRVR